MGATPSEYGRWRAWDSGARQRVSAFWLDYVRSDPMLHGAFLTVELRVGGKTILLAREPIRTVRGSTGEVMDYLPGLDAEPEIRQAIALGNQAASARSVQIAFPAFMLDANEIIKRGGALSGAGEVALQVPGGDYDLRWVLLRGPITGGLVFGDRSEIATATISDPRILESRRAPGRVVDEDSWPKAQPEVVGQRIPRVYNGATALPALRVLDDYTGDGLYFAVADSPDTLQISEVYVNGEAKASGDTDYGWLPLSTRDADGQPTLVVSASGEAGAWVDRDAVNATLTRASGTPARGAIWIARELMGEFGMFGPLGLNLDLWAQAETRMGPTAPNVMINASGRDAPAVLDYIESGLLASYPMAHLAYVGAGLGAVVIDRRVGPGGRGVVGRLVGGQYPLLDRASAYAQQREVFTDYELRYDFDPMAKAYKGIIRRHPGNSRRCALAEREIQGRRDYGAIESPHITSAAEAEYVIEWLVAHYSVPRFEVEWACLPWAAMRYRPGDLVWYTDPENDAFEEVAATVLGTTWARGAWGLSLLVWPRERPRVAVTHPEPPEPAVVAGYGDVETGGIATGGSIETEGV